MAYAGFGKPAHHPEVLLRILIYGYATGVYTSRTIERACRDSLPLLIIAANTHPDHDAVDSMLIVGHYVVQAVNDKKQVEPMLQKLDTLPECLGKVHTILGDAGYFSANNVDVCAKAGVTPLIAPGREEHYHSLETLQNMPEPLPADVNVDPLTRMKQFLKTKEGRQQYGRRKCTVEPVFGIIKQVMKFRQFTCRGLDRVRSEWGWVSLAWNVRRMAVLKAAIAG